MDVNDLMKRAWAAVEQSGVPESLQPAAFKEAVDYLRSDEQGPTTPEGSGKERQGQGSKGSGRTDPADGSVDEATFFANLAAESGESEQDLRDVLQLTADNKVQVTVPTKDLGTSVAEQAKTTVALVASARAHGLQEKPVAAKFVRREVDRKNCYQSNNFATNHLGATKGFNPGSDRSQIVLNSKWVGEFGEALAKALGRSADGGGSGT